jgi:cytochrome c-type biogenesis protein CcmH/NrfG
MKKNKFIFLFAALIATTGVFAQSVEQGKRFFYYQRYNSATDQFQKLIAANPNNIEAVYWLGQTMIQNDDSLSAKALYQKALASNGSAPLILVGTGHIELLENKANDARQRFETALSLTKGRDIEVINAIARANTDAIHGDANYALEKLNAAATAQRKDMRTAESFVLMGDAYRKLINGGGAVTAYQKALAMDPKLAEAHYKIGKVYLTQNNSDFFLKSFEDAVQADPNYGPALFELYFYYFNRDINKARSYFDKYLAVSDVTPGSDYERVSIIWASRDFQGAIKEATAKINQLGDKADPRYFKLVAYSYDELKDSVNAKNYLDQYFAKQKQDAFVPKDYVFRAQLLSRFPGNEAEALKNFESAVALDTLESSRIELMREAATFANKAGNRKEEANWLGRLYRSKKEPVQTDLYYYGYAHYMAGNYDSAYAIFCDQYQTKFPTEIYGYLWCARAAQQMDTTQEKGTAVEPYKKLIAYADTAREKYKGQLVQAHGYLASYYANVAKQKDSAIASLKKVLEIDPTNATAQQYIDALERPARSAAPAQKTTTTKTPATKPKTPAKPPVKKKGA